MTRIITYLKNGFLNGLVCLLNVFIRRDNSVILIGSWMGEKFADNSRFLYQYLHHEKKRLSLKRVIWVTRSEQLLQELSEMGYEVYLCGTRQSFYWHLKAGVHIVCNAIYVLQNGRFQPDIETSLSYGAKRIQLWHGIAIKSVGAASNETKQNHHLAEKTSISWLKTFLSRGGWADYYLLSTSEKNKEDNYQISRCPRNNIFISSYPRTFECLELLPKEMDVLNEINQFKTKIIYLPTFRSTYNHYQHPLTNEKLVNYLEENQILWIEKQHSASNFSTADFKSLKNVYFLNENFDVNVLYEHVDGVVSDYSSAVFDAVYRNVPIVMYTPDVEEFRTGDVGLLFDLEDYCSSLMVETSEELLDMIDDVRQNYFTDKRISDYERIMTLFYDNRQSTYEEFWKDIISL
ncbi:CDP-glycerol glycerophosphotransferase family protein [Streptococcus thoraltensis]|uniref:CDP-glycerol glycerophosphotransferase family protein n=1 Tax=Streptococcus thoraltensis TaxID=55085 RepID=UPI002A824846|nr:CDP-glycerol glycerophosphotransferase family protein [Streptococcus thoraltensis]MDY4760941.1 CDP-glycerol glycerophosphotransferase family protein [Streptococcus thoraltensis]